MAEKQLIEEIKYYREERHFSYKQISNRLGHDRQYLALLYRRTYGSDNKKYLNKIRYEKHCKQCGLLFVYLGYGRKLICDTCKNANYKALKKTYKAFKKRVYHEREKHDPIYRERKRAYSKKYYWTKIRPNPEKMAAASKRLAEYQKKKYQTSAKFRKYKSKIAKAYKERVKLKRAEVDSIHKMPS